MTDVPATNQQANDDGRGNGNGGGIDSGSGLVADGFEFTFSLPSVVAQACADANARKIAAVGKVWQQASLSRLEGEGRLATPRTVGVDKEAQTADEEQSSPEEICLLRARLRASEERVEGLLRLLRAKAQELSLSREGHAGSGSVGDQTWRDEEALLLERLTTYEDTIRRNDKEIKRLKEAATEQKAVLENTKREVTAREKHIAGVEKQLSEDAETLKKQETDLARNQQRLDAARAGEKAKADLVEHYKKKYEGTLEDCKGLRAKCAELKKAGTAADKASAELSNLRIQAAIYKDAADDIKYERERNKALREEILKLKEDIESLGFSPDAAELHETPNTPPRKNLEDELADAQSSASEAESDGESNGEDETPRPSRSAPAPVLPEVIEKIVEKIVTQEVYVTRTAFVDRPFQISAHNPFKCWFQVELNFLILFYAFIKTFFSIIARFSRKISGAPAIEESTKPTTSNSTSGETTPTMDTRHVTEGLKNLTTESTHGLQPDGGSQETTTKSANGKQPFEIDLESLRPSAWTWSMVTNPKRLPSARTTILALACHMVVYASVLLMYGAYTERRRWLDANDGTRIFVRQLLNRPGSFRSGVSKILFMLPEEWKHAIDRALFETVVLGSNMHISQPRPG